MPPRAPHTESGFTLLETLVALTVLAIALTSLFEAHSSALRATGASEDTARARLLAETLLGETIGNWHGGAASRSGHDGRFSWQVDIGPANASWAALKSEAGWRLYRIDVRVAWNANRRVALSTLKLGAGP